MTKDEAKEIPILEDIWHNELGCVVHRKEEVYKEISRVIDIMFDQHEEQIKQLKEYIDDLEYQLGMEVEKHNSFYNKGWKDRDKQSVLEY